MKVYDSNNNERKPIILALINNYLPGCKSGGPIKSLANIVSALGDEYTFKILTKDRDLGDSSPYDGIVSNMWVNIGKAEIMYLSTKHESLWNIYKILKNTDYDILYLNSFMGRRFSMFPNLLVVLGLIKRVPVVIASRGEFSKGALNIKVFRKRIFMNLVKALNIYRNVIWHASTENEKNDIKRAMFNSREKNNLESSIESKIFCASNIAQSMFPSNDYENVLNLVHRKKNIGELKIVFLSRISPMKNLLGAIKAIEKLNGNIIFNIYGPCEDKEYWCECQQLIDKLQKNVKVKYSGLIESDKVYKVFLSHHVFLFPTFGENFGHVIMESVQAGCPVVISDQTPWRGLESLGIGWDLPLDDKLESFTNILQKMINMNQSEFNAISKLAAEYGHFKCNDNKTLEDNRKLFDYAISVSNYAENTIVK